MNIWRDKTLGETGSQKWILVIGSIAMVAIFVHLIFPEHSPATAINTILPAVILILPIAWALFYISQATNVLQEVSLDGERLVGKRYFGRLLSCAASDIQSLSYYPMTWNIRYINLYDSNKPGINIELRNGDIFRINARTEGFAQLVDELKKFSKLSDQMVCSL